MEKLIETDIHNYKNRLNATTRNIENATFLSSSVKKALLDWKQFQVRNDLKTPTIEKNIGKAYNLMKLFPQNKELNEFNLEDRDKAIDSIMEQGKYTDWTRSLYKRTIKAFFKFVGREDIAKDIKTGVKKSRQKIPEELLTEEEILKVINECENHRDRALITLLYETGCRIGELGGIRLKDLTFEDGEGTIILTGKTGTRKVLIQFCVPYIKNFLEIHKEWNKSLNQPKDKNALLFYGIGFNNAGKQLNYAGIRQMLIKTVKKAGIDKPCNPHHFRHSRASYLAKFLTEAQLCYVMGWEMGSDMPRTYVHLSGKDVNDSLRGIYNKKPKEEITSILATSKCSICGEVNEPTKTICSKCNNPLNIKGVLEKQSKTTELEKKVSMLEAVLTKMDKLESLESKIDKLFSSAEAKQLLDSLKA